MFLDSIDNDALDTSGMSHTVPDSSKKKMVIEFILII